MAEIRMGLWVCTICSGHFMLDADLLDADEDGELELSCPYCGSEVIGQYAAERAVN